MQFGYDINGKEILIAECRTCGHQVSILRDAFIMNGLDKTVFQGFADDCNDLSIFDKVAECCHNPKYYW